jgi:hypothetical protein
MGMRNWTHLSRTLPLLFAVASLAACAPPVADEPGETSEAICGNGVKPGCDACQPNPDSPKGGYQSCWTCDGDQTERACSYRSKVQATWSGTLHTWSYQGVHRSGSFSIPVTLTLRGSANWLHWGWTTGALHVDLGGGYSVSFPSGSGEFFDDPSFPGSVDLAAQLHAYDPATQQDIYVPGTMALSTDDTIWLPGAQVTGSRVDMNQNFTMVGHTGIQGESAYPSLLELNSHISAVP